MAKVVYPGSFDPITNGHIDLATRALGLFDGLVILIAQNQRKPHLFSLEKRLQMTQQAFAHHKKVEIVVLKTGQLVIDYVQKLDNTPILRGLRAVSDFEFEFQLAEMNRKLNSRIETIFLTPSAQHAFISSSLVKEVAQVQAQGKKSKDEAMQALSQFVPDFVALELLKAF